MRLILKIKILIIVIFFDACNQKYSSAHDNKELEKNSTEFYFQHKMKPFYHGVASGDPKSNEVIIWTRLTPKYYGNYMVKWEVSTTHDFKKVLQSGKIMTNSDIDFTVKKLIKGLEPDTYYWYRFSYDSSYSVIGRTKTLPINPNKIRLISVSCNSYEGGYFNTFKLIAEDTSRVDAVIHLGDYIYEGFLSRFITKNDRIPLPKKELISLKDYRTRYAQYRLDKDLQKVHQMHPFITIWDDHEIANDAYVSGAQAHDPKKEGSYRDRKSSAVKAYYEWIPINNDSKHNRKFEFGDLATLFMLDERLSGRTEQMKKENKDFYNSERKMLGDKQFDWLIKGLNKANGWKIIGNQVLFANFDFSPVADMSERKIDQWSGYPSERNKFIDNIENFNIENIVLLSGDSHCSWAFEVKGEKYSVALELGIPSVSSGNWGSNKSNEIVNDWEDKLINSPKNQHLKYVDLKNKGFGVSEFTKNRALHYWIYVDADKIVNKATDTVFIHFNKSSNKFFK